MGQESRQGPKAETLEAPAYEPLGEPGLISARGEGAQDVAPLRATGLRASMRRAAQYVWKEWQNTRATKQLAQHAAQILVCTHEEARRLRGIVTPERRTVIPHFVEDRSIDVAPPAGELPADSPCPCAGVPRAPRNRCRAIEPARGLASCWTAVRKARTSCQCRREAAGTVQSPAFQCYGSPYCCQAWLRPGA